MTQNRRRPTILPDGGSFGNERSDEFFIEHQGERSGVFKRFEYESVPFTLAGEEQMFRSLLTRAKSGSSFAEELERDPEAKTLVDDCFEKMSSSPAFSKQVLELALPKVYIKDNLLNSLPDGETLEENLAKVLVGWEEMADFYCIEGLVGGAHAKNPFTKSTDSSLIAGGLDSLERILPSLKKRSSTDEWRSTCLQLSSIIGRDHRQIDASVGVLKMIFGEDEQLNGDAARHRELIRELGRSDLSTTMDVGKFYNSLIRFHNWLPIALKRDDTTGDQYDSICAPTKRALGSLEESPEIAQQLSQIKDATSPKGLALIDLVQRGALGDASLLERDAERTRASFDGQKEREMMRYATMTFEDHAFYSGLTGGKWKGLKLLHDTREAFGLNYSVPSGVVITSVGVNKILHDAGVEELILQQAYKMDEQSRQAIVEGIAQASIEGVVAASEFKTSALIARSSMHGEDGASNFSGTYDSIACDTAGLEDAVKGVIASYFSREAVKSREEIGLAHLPGINVIVQERVAGIGGVMHIIDGQASLSFAETAEDAVNGNGNYKRTRSIGEAIAETPLASLGRDIGLLHELYGNLDLEFVVAEDKSVHFTQMRPKHAPLAPTKIERDLPCVEIDSLDSLRTTSLSNDCAVYLRFLGEENLANKEGEIMDFIRGNRQHIKAVYGAMPSVAHIPNKIEGHFRIPYMTRGAQHDNT